MDIRADRDTVFTWDPETEDWCTSVNSIKLWLNVLTGQNTIDLKLFSPGLDKDLDLIMYLIIIIIIWVRVALWFNRSCVEVSNIVTLLHPLLPTGTETDWRLWTWTHLFIFRCWLKQVRHRGKTEHSESYCLRQLDRWRHLLGTLSLLNPTTFTMMKLNKERNEQTHLVEERR